jgi:hypothetical protein
MIAHDKESGIISNIPIDKDIKHFYNILPDQWTFDEQQFYDCFLKKRQRIIAELTNGFNIMRHKVHHYVKEEFSKITLDSIYDFADFLSSVCKEDISADAIDTTLQIGICTRFMKCKNPESFTPNSIVFIPEIDAEYLFPMDPSSVEKSKIFLSTLVTSSNLIQYIYDYLLLYDVGELKAIEWCPVMYHMKDSYDTDRTFKCVFTFNPFDSKTNWFGTK